ncbi:hypothetical protein O9929_25915 [Vibrio lentus]|nr:hypothetical protein [Vibrio lentus]
MLNRAEYIGFEVMAGALTLPEQDVFGALLLNALVQRVKFVT